MCFLWCVTGVWTGAPWCGYSAAWQCISVCCPGPSRGCYTTVGQYVLVSFFFAIICYSEPKCDDSVLTWKNMVCHTFKHVLIYWWLQCRDPDCTQDQKRYDNLGSGSWLAWANDTAAHYAVIRCLQLDSWFAASRHTTAPISHTGPCSL